MAPHVKDILAQRATGTFVGRTDELAVLLGALEPDGPPVVFVHGLAGIGKTSLLELFAARARARGAAVVRLDCRAIEPTARGFLHELGAAIGGEAATPEEAADRLGRLGGRVVLALDTYEVFRLMDTWLRQVFVPALPDNARVVLVGRDPPVPAWLASAGWHGLVRSVALGPLDERDAVELLTRCGVKAGEAQRINRFTCGHPLGIRLAASTVTDWHDSGHGAEAVALQRVVEELTRLYLADVSDPLTRQALDAASVVRRTTLSLLNAMLPAAAPQDAFERLRALPFVESRGDGLHVHDAVRQAIAARLEAADPCAYHGYRRAAWRQLRAELRGAGMPSLWRYTADLLYLIENPVVREAFFPSGVHRYAVESARPDDGAAVHEIVERHEGPTAAALLDAWWARAPQAFSVVRDWSGTVAGFYCMVDPAAVGSAHVQDDPIVREWRRHLRSDPVPRNQRVLFLRRWLGRDSGERLSAVQAACWLDIKRSYMALRPHLRRVYLTVNDVGPYARVARQLGFRLLPDADVTLDGAAYRTAVLDFGPASVDGWLLGLIAAELGVEEPDLFDVDARELVLDGRRIGLTRLEFSVLLYLYLYQREGKAVTREALREDVWGYHYDGGSNVVEAVVRSLRKKLGERASMIETVRGVGYRLRRL